jgi:hypothetical protein
MLLRWIDGIASVVRGDVALVGALHKMNRTAQIVTVGHEVEWLFEMFAAKFEFLARINLGFPRFPADLAQENEGNSKIIARPLRWKESINSRATSRRAYSFTQSSSNHLNGSYQTNRSQVHWWKGSPQATRHQGRPQECALLRRNQEAPQVRLIPILSFSVFPASFFSSLRVFFICSPSSPTGSGPVPSLSVRSGGTRRAPSS